VSVLYLTHRDCALHEMGEDHPECPDRLRAVWQALDRQEFTALIRGEAEEATMEQLARVHPEAYLRALLAVRPEPGDYVALDADTVMNHATARAALLGAGAAVQAADAVCTGQVRRAFCATRPPGITPSAPARWASACSPTP
jgi:acetoin utilization deacetylase AcuC-like enzyme